MASTIPVVLDFLATLIGIGGKITEIIQKALKSVTQPIQDAIDAVLLAIKKAIGGFIDRLLGKGKPGEAPAEVAPGTPMTTEQIIAAVVPILSQPTQATDPAAALTEKKGQAEQLKQKFQPSAPEGKTLHIEFKDHSSRDVESDHKIAMAVGFSPETPVVVDVPEVGQPLRETKVEADFTIAIASPLTALGLDKGSPTSGEVPEPFRSAVKLATPGTLAKRQRERAKAAAEGRSTRERAVGAVSRVYDRIHLVAGKLGGPGTPNNLVIGTISANALMRGIEGNVFKALAQPAMTQAGRTLLDPSDPKKEKKLTKTFEYSVDTGNSAPTREPGDATPPNAATQQLRILESKLRSPITVNAQEIIDRPGGATEEGKAQFHIVVSNRLPITFIP